MNKGQHQFELRLEDDLAFISFKTASNGDLYLVHTEVPDKYNGKGVAHKLVRESIGIIEELRVKIIPLCPFIQSFVQENLKEYQHLISSKSKML